MTAARMTSLHRVASIQDFACDPLVRSRKVGGRLCTGLFVYRAVSFDRWLAYVVVLYGRCIGGATVSAHFSPRLREVRASEFPHLEAHWNDPAARLRERAEIDHYHALSMSMMDRVLAPAKAKQVAAWEQEYADWLDERNGDDCNYR